MRPTLTFLALMLMLAQVSAFAQVHAVPQAMNFQGRLARPDGTPVADGTYAIRFRLYNALTGGRGRLYLFSCWSSLPLPCHPIKVGI